MFHRIIVPLDGSRFGGRALKYAAEIAEKFDSELILLQIVIPVTPQIESVSMRISVDVAQSEEKLRIMKAHRYLRRKTHELLKQKLKARYEINIGFPATGIIKFARKAGADLVIMTSHGKQGIKRAIQGSVSDEVVRKSGTPVLIIGSGTKN